MRAILIAAALVGCGEDRVADVDRRLRGIEYEQNKARLEVPNLDWWCTRGWGKSGVVSFCVRDRVKCDETADAFFADTYLERCSGYERVVCFQGKPREPSCHPSTTACLAAERAYEVASGSKVAETCRTRL